ncbi:hypothetical protein HY008_02895 [Candidatus Woesebacteria bacterium]|nr:hypothetical protein [Candidatus Woesebacteria bacterium]
MQEKLQSVFLWLQERKLFVAIGVILLLVLLSVLLLFKNQQTGETKPQPSKLSQLSETSPKPSPLPPPKVYFETYENRTPLPTVPETVNGYTLKTNYSLDEAKEFGKILGLTEVKTPDDKFVILYNLTEMNNRGILTFNRETGGISFQSYGVHKAKVATHGLGAIPSTSNSTQEPILNNSRLTKPYAEDFLNELGLWDATLSCPISYEKKGLPGVTFVECHRDWSKVELPILNAIGVLNIPESKRLTDLALGGVDENTPNDSSII